MEFFKWDKTYSLNHETIDLQHQELFRIVNKLYDAFMKKEHVEVLSEILNELVSYAKYHFIQEEKYFHVYKYERTHEHIAKHNEFTKKIQEFQAEYKTKKAAITFQLMNFLRDWLKDHILVEDKKYQSILPA